VLEARGTRRNIEEINSFAPGPNIPATINAGGTVNAGISVVTTEPPNSHAGTQFGRQAHAGAGRGG
jgi:hypothetical protein